MKTLLEIVKNSSVEREVTKNFFVNYYGDGDGGSGGGFGGNFGDFFGGMGNPWKNEEEKKGPSVGEIRVKSPEAIEAEYQRGIRSSTPYEDTVAQRLNSNYGGPNNYRAVEESFRIELNTQGLDYTTIHAPTYLEFTPRFDFSGHDDLQPHLNLDFKIGKVTDSPDLKILDKFNDKYEKKGFTTHYDLFNKKDKDIFGLDLSLLAEALKDYKK